MKKIVALYFGLFFLFASPVFASTSSNPSLLDSLYSQLLALSSYIQQLKPTTQTAALSGAGSQLVGYWTFDEGSGTTAGDTSGANHPGTVTNGATWTTGKAGGALNFDAVDDYVNLGNITSFNGLSAITVSAWVKWTRTPNPYSDTPAMIVSKNNPYGVGTWDLYGKDPSGASGAASFSVVISGVPISSGNSSVNASDGSWHHVLGRYDGANVSVWVDGIKQSEAPATGALDSVSTPVVIAGVGSSVFGWPGLIDDVRIYNRALLPQEITDLYNLNSGVTPPVNAVPVISSFSASPASISSGNSSTLSWNVSGYPTPTFSINNGVGTVTGSSVSVSPTVTTPYTLTATNSQGTVTSNTTVTVTAPNNTAPTVSLTAPTGGTVSGNVTVTATASDNKGISGVQFKLDGLNLQSEDTSSPYSITWDTTTATNGSHTLTATARDTSNNTGNSAGVNVTVLNIDSTPPNISSINASSVIATGATITWSTDENADTQVEYGLTTSYGSNTTLNTSLSTSHSQTLTGLTPSTLYYYRVKSKDASNNLTTSADRTFTTPSAVSSGLTVPTYFSAKAVAPDQVNLIWLRSTVTTGNVSSYTILRNGTVIGTVSHTPYQAPYHDTEQQYYQDMTVSPNTTYTYTVSATDSAGNSSSQTSSLSATTPAGSSALIPANRLANWVAGVTVGVPGGIDQYITGAKARTRLIDVTKAPYNADNTGATDSTTVINNAINAAVDNDVVYLPAGTYTVSGIGVNFKSNITIRGAGMNSTIINCNATACINIRGSSFFNNPSFPILSGISVGSTQVTVSDTSGYLVNTVAQISTKDDTSLPVMSVGGYENARLQTVLITGKTGNTLTFTPPLMANFSTTQSLLTFPSYQTTKYVGVEDLTINNASQSGITMEGVYGAWVKNVKATSQNYPINVGTSVGCEIRHNNIVGPSNAGTNAGGILFGSVTGCLVEDNIIRNTFPLIEVNFSSMGNVFGYNYMPDGTANINHGPHNSYNLYEGNYLNTGTLMSDGYFGSDSEETFFRNWTSGYFSFKRFSRNFTAIGNVLGSYSTGQPNIGNGDSTGFVLPSQGVYWQDWNLSGPQIKATLTTRTSDSSGVFTVTSGDSRLVAYCAFFGGGNCIALTPDWGTGRRYGMAQTARAGNVITLTGGYGTALPPQGTVVGFWPRSEGFQELDMDVGLTLIRKGNSVGGSIPANEAFPSGQSLPNSLYLSSKPAWFGSLSWPPVNPVNPGATTLNSLPAGYRFNNPGQDTPGLGTTPVSSALFVTVVGTGSVSGTGISCGSDCTETVSNGTSITLTATPTSGSTFTGWSGACSGVSTCTVTINSNTSVTATFTTSVVLDTTFPTVSITSPTAGVVSGTSVSLSASASDNIGIASVRFLIDGSNIDPLLTNAPYSGTWDTLGVSNGVHTLTTQATDTSGNTTTSAGVSITVSNADTTLPQVNTFTLPSTSASLTVSISSLTATDNVGVTHYKVTETSSTPLASASGWTTSAPTSYTFSTAGSKTLYAWAKDSAGNVSSSRSAVTTITLPNNAPILTSIGNKSIAENSLLTFTLSATDADSDPLTYSANTLPSNATLSNNIFSFTPSFTQSGTYTITFSVSDSRGGVDTETITITVLNTNRPPVVSGGADQTLTLPATASLTAVASDPDNTALTYTWSKVSGAGAVTFSSSNSLTTTATFSTQGVYVIQVTVSDGTLSSSDTVSIGVNQAVPLDTDSDGVVDSLDLCPNTLSSLSSVVNLKGCPLPKVTKFTVTPQLTSADLNSVSNLSLSNTFGSVTFSSPVSLIRSTSQVDIDTSVNIAKGVVSIDSPVLPELNVPATITLYNIVITNPAILKDNALCDQCKTVSYNGSTFVFSVPSFSTYRIIADVTAPTITPSTVEGTTLSGTQSLSATVTDDVSLQSVSFYLDSNLLTTASTPPFTYILNTLGVSNGAHTLFIVATDSSGNQATSTVSITVLNTTTVTPTTTVSHGGGGGGGSRPPTGVLTPTVPQTPLIPSSSPSVSSPFTQTLSLGVTSPEVLLLQQYLNQQGYTISLTGIGSTGNESTYFGDKTRLALIRYQVANSLPPTGQVDATTLAHLKTKVTSSSLTKAQLIAQLIAQIAYLQSEIQKILNARKLTTPTYTPTYTPPVVTTSPSSSYTTQIADLEAKLNVLRGSVSIPLFTRSLSVGSVGDDVVRLRNLLASEGFTTTDSTLDSSTFTTNLKTALAKFQEYHRDTILAPNNFLRGEGGFGPSTRQAINDMLTIKALPQDKATLMKSYVGEQNALKLKTLGK